MHNKFTNEHAVSGCLLPALSIGNRRLVFITIAILYWIQAAYSQPAPAIEWDKTFGGIKQEEMYNIIQTTDGGYLLGGDSDSPPSGTKSQGSQGFNDYWVVKTNALGTKVWDKRFGGNSREELFSLKQTPDGGYLLGGWSMSIISGDQTQSSRGSSDYWIVKIDANGNKLWDKRYGGPGDDELRAMSLTDDGGYIFVGESSSGIGGEKTQVNYGQFDVWVVKTDINGNLQWEATYGGTLDDRVNAIQQTEDGGYVIGAWTISPEGFDVTQAGRGSSDMWVVRTDANGQKLWDGRYGGNDNEYLYGLDQTQDGGFILGGYTRSNVNGEVTIPGKGGFDFWMVKTNSVGVKLWDKRYGGTLDEKGKSIAETIDGGFIMGGWSESPVSGDKTESSKGESDYWVIKTAADGNILWDKDLGALNEERLHDVMQTSDGGYIVAGHSFSGSNGDKTQSNTGINDYWIVKLASTIPTQLYYADTDNDGFGDPAKDTLTVAPPAGYVSNNTDCNDNVSAVNPGVTEICNAGIDDNCNGLADDGDTTVTGQFPFYTDNDFDQHGSTNTVFACIQPAGSVLTNEDCNDTDAAIHPGAAEICNAGIDDNCNGLADDGDTTVTGQQLYYTDSDLDQYGSTNTVFACIQPAGSALTNDDCNDNVAAIHPGAIEICNAGIDDNCNGLSDDSDTTLIGLNSYYADLDHDNYGSGEAVVACTQPMGTVQNAGDCNDSDAGISPAAAEICNAGIDDNCNGLADDNDTSVSGQGHYFIDSDNDNFGSNDTIFACIQPAGTILNGNDCNDNELAIHPQAKEICNGGIDDNCNGVADDADNTTIGLHSYYTDNDNDQFGSGAAIKACIQPEGTAPQNDDCNNNNAAIYPGALEICNGGIDDDCNGLADDGDTTAAGLNIYYLDSDGDTYGAGTGLQVCLQPEGTSASGNDCNDANAAIHPAAIDICNGIDDNCDLAIDENQLPIPVISPAGDISACSGEQVNLSTDYDPLLSYQWYKGNTPVNGATSSNYATTKAGSFKVKITAGAGCEATSSFTKITRIDKPDAIIQVLGNLDICTTGAVDLLANEGTGFLYQWKKGSSIISGATDFLYTATSKGTYRVIVTNSAGCSKTSGTAKVISSCKAEMLSAKQSNIELEVYPNPADRYLMLAFNFSEESTTNVTIELVDLLGRIVQIAQVPVSGTSLLYELPLEASIADGNYLVRVTTGGQVMVQQVIVQQ